MTNQMMNDLNAMLNATSELRRDCVGVWIPDAAIIEAERRRQEELDQRQRPFLEVPRHPVMEESPPEPSKAPGGTVIILDI